MSGTARQLSDLDTLFADNVVGAISPQDLRDFLWTALGCYGSLYCFNAATAQGGLGTTPAKLDCFTVEGNAANVTPDAATDTLQVGITGKYDGMFQVSFSGNGAHTCKFRLRVNDVETQFGCTRKLGTGGDVGSASFFAPGIALTALDEVSIYVETDDAGNGDIITVSDAQFSLKMVG